MATHLEQAEAVLTKLGLEGVPVEILGAGAKRGVKVALPNGRVITVSIGGNPSWAAELEKNIRKFKNKE